LCERYDEEYHQEKHHLIFSFLIDNKQLWQDPSHAHSKTLAYYECAPNFFSSWKDSTDTIKLCVQNTLYIHSTLIYYCIKNRHCCLFFPKKKNQGSPNTFTSADKGKENLGMLSWSSHNIYIWAFRYKDSYSNKNKPSLMDA